MQRYKDSLLSPSLQSITFQAVEEESALDFSLLKSSQSSIQQKEDRIESRQGAKKASLQQRTPFQNIFNSIELNTLENSHLPHFKKTSSLFSNVPSLKDKRLSQYTKQNQPQATLDDTLQTTKQSKRQNIFLAQDLQNKMKQLDVKLNEKIKTLKEQFWETRSKSLRLSQNKNVSVPKDIKRRLIDHLNKKPSNQECHKQLKDCYLKFIPMRQILTSQGMAIKNPKIVQSKFLTHFQAQLKL